MICTVPSVPATKRARSVYYRSRATRHFPPATGLPKKKRNARNAVTCARTRNVPNVVTIREYFETKKERKKRLLDFFNNNDHQNNKKLKSHSALSRQATHSYQLIFSCFTVRTGCTFRLSIRIFFLK
jgi:hypothetical protein